MNRQAVSPFLSLPMGPRPTPPSPDATNMIDDLTAYEYLWADSDGPYALFFNWVSATGEHRGYRASHKKKPSGRFRCNVRELGLQRADSGHARARHPRRRREPAFRCDQLKRIRFVMRRGVVRKRDDASQAFPPQ
jgi:hypothetical protein